METGTFSGQWPDLKRHSNHGAAQHRKPDREEAGPLLPAFANGSWPGHAQDRLLGVPLPAGSPRVAEWVPVMEVTALVAVGTDRLTYRFSDQ